MSNAGPRDGHLVGRVVELRRYPVKSMAPEDLQDVEVGWQGLAGDRRWAFVRGGMERSGFPWLTIRERPELWHYRPRIVDAADPDRSATVVRTPDGRDLDVVDPELAAELGHDARVIRQARGVFDTFPLSLITTQTVAGLARLVGTPLSAVRFRPNLLVEAIDGADFPEDAWVGGTLRIGEAAMRVDKRDGRCMMVNVDPETAERDPATLRAIASAREGCLGVYGTTIRPGRIAVGDEVILGS